MFSMHIENTYQTLEVALECHFRYAHECEIVEDINNGMGKLCTRRQYSDLRCVAGVG